MKKLIIKGMHKRYFSDKVVKWYEEHHRSLPWRDTKDPYRIWLSEIILQQTRVNQGLPYYERFVEQYPTVKGLALADEQQVLRLWQGLGYYSRARNLHKCAREVYYNHGGKFPASYAGLLQLPGVGEYTAAAIASFAFREPVAVVDGNVFRVLARIFGIETPIQSPQGKREFTTLANELINKDTPDTHNQAVMEFGALWCTPKAPACDECTFAASCVAFQKNMQSMLPVKAKAKPTRKRYFYYLVIRKGKSILMKKREGRDIWTGLYDFVLIEKKKSAPVRKLLSDHEPLLKKYGSRGSSDSSPYFKHVLSHQTIFAKFISVEVSGKVSEPESKFYTLKQIAELPKPVLISRFLDDAGLLKSS